jgi:hypothetical protein
MEKYFVMMYSQKGDSIMSIVEVDEYDNENVKLYDSYEEAENEMKDHAYASQLGYEIFDILI